MTDRRVLFDINHPAQVHLFKHAIRDLEAAGHETAVAARDKEITLDLLEESGIPYTSLSTAASGTAGLVRELLGRERRLFSFARRFDPDVIVSRLSPAAAHVSTLVGCPNIVFTDTVVPSRLMRTLNYNLTLPFVDVLCTPPEFEVPVSVAETYEVGFHELAYLHPDRFTPDRDRLAAQGVDVENPYFVVRFAGWDAYHDVGTAGWSADGQQALVEFLSTHGTVYVTSEGDLPAALAPYELSIPPTLIHDLLSCATLYVGDSQTMPTEAALLGTPAIRVNGKVDRHEMHNFRTLDRYGLLFSYRDEAAALSMARDIVDGEHEDTDWAARRQSLLASQCDVTEFMLDLILDREEPRELPAHTRTPQPAE